jgi:hypothetical protein
MSTACELVTLRQQNMNYDVQKQSLMPNSEDSEQL